MRSVACLLVLFVVGGVAVAQQQTARASAMPGPVFPAMQSEGDALAVRAAQPSEALTPPEVDRLILDTFGTEPSLAGASLTVKTDDQSVTLAGRVEQAMQRDLALQIAKAYAGTRQVVDNIRTR